MTIKRGSSAIRRVKKASTPKKRNSSHELPKLELSERVSREVWGLIWTGIAVLLALSLFGNGGTVGSGFQTALRTLFGIGAWLMPIFAAGIAVALFFARDVVFHFTKGLGIVLMLLSILGMIHLSTPFTHMDENVEAFGGWMGFTVSVLLRLLFSSPESDLAATVILGFLFVIGVMITFNLSLKRAFEFLLYGPEPAEEGEIEEAKMRRAEQVNIIAPSYEPQMLGASPKMIEAAIAEVEEVQIRRPEALKPLKKPEIQMRNSTVENWQPPSLDLLSSEISEVYEDEEHLRKKAEEIRETLHEFDIDVKMRDVHVGPTVTQFSLEPPAGVKLTKITGLKQDLALALATSSVRIEAPIPGKSLVGIEIPNEERATVRMREIMESDAFSKIDSSLRLPLGRDVAGMPIVADLAKMPHLLIAGATGAGKSVGMNAFLIALLYQNAPQDLKFIMIDPKRVELTTYNGIPHLLTPVITEADKALAALRWAVAEMMRRYEECSQKGYRNIAEYNAGEEKKMPKIVIVIDELADLMMREFKKDTEAAICRLAQMARAVGMHLIVATQRPSVDVITGLIKANIPSRISFTVTSAVDSRTILDSIGAEDLLGMGDMLFTNPALPKPQRVQGIYLSSTEIEKVTNAVKLQIIEEEDESVETPKFTFEERTEPGNGLVGMTYDSSADEMLEQAIEVVRETQKASATLLQRRLSVGYARAAKLLDIMEEQGLIGPVNGAKPREIYLD